MMSSAADNHIAYLYIYISIHHIKSPLLRCKSFCAFGKNIIVSLLLLFIHPNIMHCQSKMGSSVDYLYSSRVKPFSSLTLILCSVKVRLQHLTRGNLC